MPSDALGIEAMVKRVMQAKPEVKPLGPGRTDCEGCGGKGCYLCMPTMLMRRGLLTQVGERYRGLGYNSEE